MKKVILIVVTLLLLGGCKSTATLHNSAFEEKINEIIKENRSKEIDINNLVDFTWDRAYIFPPYTTQESINKELGISFKDPSDIEVRDDIHLIVFKHDNKVVQYAEILRRYGDLVAKHLDRITPSDSIILIRRN
ncbi:MULTISPECIES: hypothetical protein [Bacillus]|uniref:hypothetical protein n=1 Tax=Bacillus TaxID=1386 RepID=UPI0002E270D6|nr:MULTISPECIES: hypothetical protein [Bacillus]